MFSYSARALTRTGRNIGDTGGYPSREAAIAAAWQQFPTAHHLSSCHSIQTPNGWWPNGSDMQWHKRNTAKAE